MPEDKVIKFIYDWEEKAIKVEKLAELNAWRDKLYSIGLIGVNEQGIGYGNISVRLGETKEFVITGSGTGKLSSLEEKHCNRVTEFDFEKSWVRCKGLTIASCESLSHAAIYCSDPSANVVIHVHSPEMWKRLLGKLPETGPGADSGTPELAEEIFRLFKEKEVKEKKIMVTAGHQDGIISFGKDLDEAGRILLKYFEG